MIKTGLLMVATLAVQRALEWPGLPIWPTEIVLPMVWIVAPPLSLREMGWPYRALFLGLGWDLLMEPVVGPGGIAWTIASIGLYATAGIMADRSPKAWFLLGGIGTLLVILVRELALLPLGIASAVTVWSVLRSVFLTAILCGLVAGIVALDIPARWRAHRLRTLR